MQFFWLISWEIAIFLHGLCDDPVAFPLNPSGADPAFISNIKPLFALVTGLDTRLYFYLSYNTHVKLVWTINVLVKLIISNNKLKNTELFKSARSIFTFPILNLLEKFWVNHWSSRFIFSLSPLKIYAKFYSFFFENYRALSAVLPYFLIINFNALRTHYSLCSKLFNFVDCASISFPRTILLKIPGYGNNLEFFTFIKRDFVHQMSTR